MIATEPFGRTGHQSTRVIFVVGVSLDAATGDMNGLILSLNALALGPVPVAGDAAAGAAIAYSLDGCMD